MDLDSYIYTFAKGMQLSKDFCVYLKKQIFMDLYRLS